MRPVQTTIIITVYSVVMMLVGVIINELSYISTTFTVLGVITAVLQIAVVSFVLSKATKERD